MERYSIIYGTDKSAQGVFGYQAMSPGLKAFLRRIGAVSERATIDVIFEYLAGFTAKALYDKTPKNIAPVSVRYSPIYLHKLPKMPNDIAPVNVLTISGKEHRDRLDGSDRETVYSHTIVLDRDLLLQPEKDSLCYLDQIFGTHQTSWTEIRDFRRGKSAIDLDAEPIPVVPIQVPGDQPVIFQAVEAIYANKGVILRLDAESSFNERSTSLLTQIYSMLQPRLAAEIGFATYVDFAEIRKLFTDTNIRIFLTPSECQIPDGFPNLVILDLAQKQAQMPNSDFAQALSLWYRLPWKRRREAMECIFLQPKYKDSYLDSDAFVEATTKFFTDPFFKWLKSSENSGTISTLRQLRKLKSQFAPCSIPWCGELFEKKIPQLLCPGLELSKLIAQTLEEAREMEANGKPISTEIKDDYLFARSFMDTTDPSKEFYRLVAQRCGEAWQGKLDEAEADFNRKLGEKDTTISQLNAKIDDAENDKARALSEAKRLHDSEIGAIKAKHELELKDEKQRNDCALRTADAAYNRKLGEKDATISQLNAKIDNAENDKSRALNEAKQLHDLEMREEKQRSRLDLQKAESEFNRQLREKNTAINQLNTKIADAEGEKNRALTQQKATLDCEKRKALEEEQRLCNAAIEKYKNQKEIEINNLKDAAKKELEQKECDFQKTRSGDYDDFIERLTSILNIVQPKASTRKDNLRKLTGSSDSQKTVEEKQSEVNRLVNQIQYEIEQGPEPPKESFFQKVWSAIQNAWDTFKGQNIAIRLFFEIAALLVCAVLVIVIAFPKAEEIVDSTGTEAPIATRAALSEPTGTTAASVPDKTPSVTVSKDEAPSEDSKYSKEELQQLVDEATKFQKCYNIFDKKYSDSLESSITDANTVLNKIINATNEDDKFTNEIDSKYEALQNNFNQAKSSPYEPNWKNIINDQMKAIQSSELESIAAFAPIQLSGDCKVLAVLSTEQIDLQNLNMQSIGKDDTFAVLVQGPLPKETAEKAEKAKLILHYCDYTVFAYGCKDMLVAAIDLMKFVEEPKDGEKLIEPGILSGPAIISNKLIHYQPQNVRLVLVPDFEGEIVTGDPSYFLYSVDETWVDLINEKVRNPEWWRGITRILEDAQSQEIAAIKKSLNISEDRRAVLSLENESFDSLVLCFENDSNDLEKQKQCIEDFNKDGDIAWQSGDYVVILHPKQNAG